MLLAGEAITSDRVQAGCREAMFGAFPDARESGS